MESLCAYVLSILLSRYQCSTCQNLMQSPNDGWFMLWQRHRSTESMFSWRLWILQRISWGFALFKLALKSVHWAGVCIMGLMGLLFLLKFHCLICPLVFSVCWETQPWFLVTIGFKQCLGFSDKILTISLVLFILTRRRFKDRRTPYRKKRHPHHHIRVWALLSYADSDCNLPLYYRRHWNCAVNWNGGRAALP